MWLEETLRQRGPLLGLLAVFLGGLALNLTPCVYPLIPVTLAFFSGQAAGRTNRVLRLALTYVLGLSISYALLGVIAARTGALLGSWLQKPVVLLAVAAVIVSLSLSMFGLYELRPPQILTRRFGHASAGFGGAFVMGLVVGLIAAPCVGPFLLGLLLFVSQLANPAMGFLIFLALGFGMGLPYVILALMVNRVNQLPKAGACSSGVKKRWGSCWWAWPSTCSSRSCPGGVWESPSPACCLGLGHTSGGWHGRRMRDRVWCGFDARWD